jgi:hypothetical protein
MKTGVKKLGKLESTQIALAVVKQAAGVKSLRGTERPMKMTKVRGSS